MTETTKKLHTVDGRVVSNKMDKTVTVLVERQVKHALYGKYLRRSTKLHAHDADNACNEGDSGELNATLCSAPTASSCGTSTFDRAATATQTAIDTIERM